MNRRPALILAGLLAALIAFNVLFRSSSGQGFNHYSYSSDAPGALPTCIDVHNTNARGGPGYQLTRLDVSLTACNDSTGELRIARRPTCSVWTVMGPGTATCTATPAGSGLRVVVDATFPPVIEALTDPPLTETLLLSPSGSISSG
ncbi:MAG TPA: hypothetical protein VFK22_02990 [Candidatus Dormibacteraeota bacterium]|nr:hypothetical protein [Candidatus Dormibacteraeota bacterium]